MTPTIRIAEDVETATRTAARVFSDALSGGGRSAAEDLPRGAPAVVLSGGSTPRALYRLLADEAGPAERTALLRCHYFWSDERAVPPESDRSNYGTARRLFLSPLGVPSSSIHPLEAWTEDLSLAADAAERTLREVVADGRGRPRFDLAMLGLGADGHTASLFPGEASLQERDRWVVPAEHPELQEARLTLTLPCLNGARRVLFLATGEQKAETVRRILFPEPGEDPLPAARVRPADGETIWILDRAAAADILDRLPPEASHIGRSPESPG